MTLFSNFITGDVRFLTFRGKPNEPRHQNINFITDHLKKISSTFYVVRETDRDGKFHYHAILKLRITPPKAWFKKGCHFHMSRVGHVTKTSNVFTEYDIHQMPKELVKEARTDNLEKMIARHLNLSAVRMPALARIENYMAKEQQDPIQYTNYTLCIHGRQYPLKGGQGA